MQAAGPRTPRIVQSHQRNGLSAVVASETWQRPSYVGKRGTQPSGSDSKQVRSCGSTCLLGSSCGPSDPKARVRTELSIRGSAFNGNLFNALLSLGKEVEFLEYENEDHILQQPVNVMTLEPPHCLAGSYLGVPKERRWRKAMRTSATCSVGIDQGTCDELPSFLP